MAVVRFIVHRTCDNDNMISPDSRSEISDTLVLVVEDNLDVQEIIKMVLRLRRVRVIPASDGIEGLRLFREHRGNLSMVLLDLLLLRMGGLELAHQIRLEDGNIPILIASGQMDDTVLDEFKCIPRVAFLHKPFTATELLKAVDDLSGPSTTSSAPGA